jgi:hypothetical protein
MLMRVKGTSLREMLRTLEPHSARRTSGFGRDEETALLNRTKKHFLFDIQQSPIPSSGHITVQNKMGSGAFRPQRVQGGALHLGIFP